MHRFQDKDKGLLEKGLVQIKLVLESWFLLFGDLDADMAFIIGTYLFLCLLIMHMVVLILADYAPPLKLKMPCLNCDTNP